MTYRNDFQAARMRREALSRELHQVRSRMDEYQELTRQKQALERELAQCARDMEQARARVELPLLQQVRVASPCKERWDDMTGDERVRFCGRCEKNVYDLSALTAAQAEALLRENSESRCVRFFRRSDGTILTSDCPVGGKRKRFWRRVTTAAVASGLAAVGITMAPAVIWTQGMESSPRDQIERRMAERMSSVLQELTAEIEKLNQYIEKTQTRLAAATTVEEKSAVQQELANLRAEVRRYRARINKARLHGDGESWPPKP
jgi:hypothetical protein